ncbi:DUF2391 family protein [Halorarius litoreus]|uniref:DUF2391 family protein n=1 Tax=Halorarius litoreus TaxID=2962676 RepID=UPI0020CC0049|nr:DUF2391 family protein [Halorarius litoreus]
MANSIPTVLRNQGRGIVGALLVVGLSFLYTMETWELGVRLPMYYLVAYTSLGLVGVLLITRHVGFRVEDEHETRTDPVHLAVSFAELVFQSFLAAYVVLLLFGIVEFGDPLETVARLGLIQVVPLGLGAAVSNRLLSESDDDISEAGFPRNLPTFFLGAVFVSFPVAPTAEVEVIATSAGWGRLALVVVLSVTVTHLVLHELEFRGHGSRIENRSVFAQIGSAFIVYAVGVVVAVAFLAAFGHFAETTFDEQVQQTIVLAFVGSIGASAGEVVL